MEKWNQFSERFQKKHSEELKSIIDNKDYSQDAKLAAAWELQKRNDNSSKTDKTELEISKKQQALSEARKKARKYQTFGPRFVAAILDGFVIMTIIWLLEYIGLETSTRISYGFTDLLPFIYSILMHANYGQTLGKMAMSIKVVDFKSESSLSLQQAFLRDMVPVFILFLMYVMNLLFLGSIDASEELPNTIPTIIFILSFIPVLWWLIEIVTMLTNEKSRALHDLIAKTVVIRVEK